MFEHDNPMIGLGGMIFGLIREFDICFYVVSIEGTVLRCLAGDLAAEVKYRLPEMIPTSKVNTPQ